MYTFLRIFIVVLLVLAVADWLAGRRARTIVANSPSAWSLVSSDIKLRSAMANESPNGNVRIYFPIVTAILLSLVFTLILRVSRIP